MNENIDPDEFQAPEVTPNLTDPEELNPGAETSDNPELEESNVINGSPDITKLGESNLPAVQSGKETKDEIFSESDFILINETIDSIKAIYEQTKTNMQIEIGTLIIEKIYDNNIELIDFSEEPSGERVHKQQIFKQVINETNKQLEITAELPKKTWLYNSVRLVIDQRELEDYPGYRDLSISHKITLLSLETKEAKTQAIEEIAGKKLSVRETRKLVDEKKPAGAQDFKSLMKNLDTIKDLDDFLGNELKTLVPDNKAHKSATTICSKGTAHLEARITAIETEIETYKKHKIILEAITKRLKETAPPPDVKKKKSKKA